MIDEENQVDGTQNPSVASPENSTAASASTTDATESPGVSLADFQLPLDEEESAAAAPVGSVEVESGQPSSNDGEWRETLAQMESQLQSLKAQLDDRTTQYMRIAADFDNYRKRTQREKEDLEQQIKCTTINELLPVVDNFERARSHIKPQTEAETTIHKSYQSVYKQLVDCLKRIGVSPMRAKGKEFDPMLHEAVMRQATDEFPEGTVMEELQSGYMLGDRVLRHALVKVAAPPEPTVDSEEPNQDASEE
ncbi:nucleotide exchange factor GrpE [Pantanalinema sp. GBBB05]|uniref:nucleotide exchange factor GrpE n=1 Tax=Pantanalinema sp. GBBB05 TaxID=2604139 RepID=UPI001D9A2B38|nr:nucleotide exchange factor GrpE [Pantanalinema sp. GBBB05]